MPQEDNNNPKSIKELIDVGSNITGSVTGATLGFLVGGPPGAVVGAAAGPALVHALKKVGNELANRMLGQREEERLGATIILTSKKIDQNFDAGLKIREDEFFADSSTERAAGKEITEGILIAAQREFQEKKLQYYANLLGNIAFHPEIDKAHANLLIRMAQRLSLRQLGILSLYGQKQNFKLKKGDFRESGLHGADKIALFQEILEMYSQGMLVQKNAILSIPDINPSELKIQGVGVTLYQLMELQNIDKMDLTEISFYLEN